MKQITITIKTENDAFQPEPYAELERIFNNLAIRCHECNLDDGHAKNGNNIGTVRYLFDLFDKNGNTVGAVRCS
jgi:hypothetical protein